MKKRLLALFLTAAITVSSMPCVFAEDGDTSGETEVTTEATTEATTETTTKETTTETTTKETTTKETTTETTTAKATTTTQKDTTTQTTTKQQSSKVSKTFQVEVEVDDTYNLGSKIAVDADELDWNSADTSIVTVNSTGKITAKKKGTVFVNATGSVGSTSYDYYFDITVVKDSDDDDDDDDDYDRTITIYVDDKKDLYDYVDDDYDADEYDWTSRNKSIATVDDEGVVKGIKAGTAVIEAESDDDEYLFKVTVKKKSSSSDDDDDDDDKVSTKTSWKFYLDEGDKLDLSKFMDEDPDDCDWDVDDDDIVDLDEKKGTIKALDTGDTVVEAEGEDDDYKFEIFVDEDYTSRTLTVKKGESKSFEDLLPEDVDEYSISSDRTTVAKLDGESKVKGVANGVATLICKHDDGDVVQIIVTVSGSATATTTTEKTTETTTSAPTTKKQTVTTTQAPNFTDISSRAWAVPAINAMSSKGFIVGRNATTFAPDDTCTRADFTIVLVKMLGLSIDATGAYNDVTADKYYFVYVSTAKIHGVEAGVANGNFRPTDSITREEMMVMVYKGLQKKGVQLNTDQKCLSNYTDGDKVTAEYKEAVAALINGNFVKGDSDTTISPDKNITRAQMAVLLNNVYNALNQ